MPYKDKKLERENARNRYRTDPEFRRKQLDATKAWYAKNKERQDAYRAAWAKKDRQENPEFYRNREFERELKKYGVTREWYDAKLAEQGGLCGICQLPEKEAHYLYGRVRRLAIDHSHTTGRARGLLCSRCNKFLNPLEEIEGWAEKALQYLKLYDLST